jgi:predicted transcriptional regulator
MEQPAMTKIEYTDLKTFCDRRGLTYEEFGRLAGDGKIHWTQLYKVITGKETPGKRSRRILDAFISRYRREIRRAIA